MRPDQRGRKEWSRCEEAIILRVDLEQTTAVDVCVRHITPPTACTAEQEAAVLFKASTVANDTLYACTQTEVLIYRTPEFEQTGYLSLPSFNDLHHVRPTAAGNLLIAVTGLDLVQEVSPAGDVVEEWSAIGEATWERFSTAIDYRQVLTTKPHRAHVNYVFYVDGQPWATRFVQKDAICLYDPSRRIDIGVGSPHDGILRNGRLYFTTVNGWIVIADPVRLEVDEAIDLNEIHKSDEALGWCRGIEVIGEHRALVGFSRLRPTRVQENLNWVKRKTGLQKKAGPPPSRVVEYDLRRRRLVREIDLEQYGLHALFSIHHSEA